MATFAGSKKMPCEFSLPHYQEILEKMQDRAGTATERNEIIIAHDVDIFPAFALQMATLEHKLGIRATYYVLLHSEWYNALSPENMAIWKQIKGMGHELALHYDGNYDGDLLAVHNAFCSMLDTNSRNVSQHLVGLTPDMHIPSTLQDRAALVRQYSYKYIADSGGWWRNGCICNHTDERLLFVCHPVWWARGENPFDEVRREAYSVVDRARTFWMEMVNEHRKQQKQKKIPVTTRST